MHGAAIGEYVCSGYIYSGYVGWIHLGDGTPANGIQYEIPFRLISRVEPGEDGTSTVTLVSGETVKLSGDRDVSASNNGIIVEREFMTWADVKSITFE